VGEKVGTVDKQQAQTANTVTVANKRFNALKTFNLQVEAL
jgi:hypothetical protein